MEEYGGRELWGRDEVTGRAGSGCSDEGPRFRLIQLEGTQYLLIYQFLPRSFKSKLRLSSLFYDQRLSWFDLLTAMDQDFSAPII
jgi:hypothetical protein